MSEPKRRSCGDDWYNGQPAAVAEPYRRRPSEAEELRAREEALSYAFAFVCACAIICAVLVAVFG